jgi:putative endonuclease
LRYDAFTRSSANRFIPSFSGETRCNGETMAKVYHIYILASRSRVLYVGVTNNLLRRVGQHRESRLPGFTNRYNISRLVHFEPFADIRHAIAREKEIKDWTRVKKVKLIESKNPTWKDLAEPRFPRTASTRNEEKPDPSGYQKSL